MSEVLEIKPADLLIDEMNPRLAEPNAGQREARRALASSLQRKVQMMARSIVEHGLNPLENHGVTPNGDGRYIVLEGNRRLLALAALENPDLLADALSPGILKEIRKLSKKYHESPIEFVNCAVSTERTGFDHWLELKHTGENEGAGVVRWGADESARFKSRSGKTSPELQVLDFLTKRGDLSMDARKNVNSTTLRRLIDSPAVRDRLGIELRNRKIFLRADETRVAKALLHVVQHLPAVTKVHTKEQRLKYAAELPSRIAVKATVESGKGTALSDAQQLGSGPTKKKTAVRTQRRREKLIPYDCVLNVTDQRVKEIEVELRKLNVDTYTNAVGILLRVFIELNLDCYIARVPLATGVDASLGKKLQDVAHDLVSKGKLTSQQAKPVNKAVAHDSFLAPSVRMMHEWVHNPHVFPVAGDLLAHWNNMQPFIAAIWR
jgi:hypothetical protein